MKEERVYDRGKWAKTCCTDYQYRIRTEDGDVTYLNSCKILFYRFFTFTYSKKYVNHCQGTPSLAGNEKNCTLSLISLVVHYLFPLVKKFPSLITIMSVEYGLVNLQIFYNSVCLHLYGRPQRLLSKQNQSGSKDLLNTVFKLVSRRKGFAIYLYVIERKISHLFDVIIVTSSCLLCNI